MEFSTLYIDIDSLFDTRLPILYKLLDDDKMIELLKRNYFNRIRNKFIGVDIDEFNLLYSKRNNITISESILTRSIVIIKEFIDETIKNSISTPYKYRPKLCLNIYPYILTENEIKLIICGLKTVTNNLCDIEVINISIELITPKYIKENFSIMIMYNFIEWFELLAKNNKFDNIISPEVTVLAPALIYCDEDIASLSRQLNTEPNNIFSTIQDNFSIYIGLRLIPVKYFCIHADIFSKHT